MLSQQASNLLAAMSNTEVLLDQGGRWLGAIDKRVDDILPHEIAEIVKFHSKGTAAAALATAWAPGVGAAVAATISAGFIWTMYGRIGAKIGLPFGTNVLKSLASGVASNLAVYVVSGLAISTIVSLVPGLGNIGASVIMGATCYALTLASGYLYLKIMTTLFAEGVDLSTVSEKDLRAMSVAEAKNSDVIAVLRQAKADFRTKEETR